MYLVISAFFTLGVFLYNTELKQTITKLAKYYILFDLGFDFLSSL